MRHFDTGETRPEKFDITKGRQFWDLGCGPWKTKGFKGIDKQAFEGVDVIHDLDITPWPFEDDQVEHFRASHILEHLHEPLKIMEEIYRCLQMHGTIEFIVPSTDGRGAWQDPTHVSYWNINSFQYYFDTPLRALYDLKCCFKPLTLVNTELVDMPMVVCVAGTLRKIPIPENIFKKKEKEDA